MTADSRLTYTLHARTRQFADRVDAARRIVERVATRRCVVSVSWGKDSVVAAHLVHAVCGRADLFHMASPAALPGWCDVRDAVLAWPRVNYREVASAGSLGEYIAWCREVGLPHDRTDAEQRKAVAVRKKTPGRAWAAEHGYEVVFLGMRSAENANTRGRLFACRGPVYDVGDMTYANPLAAWTARDVWAYTFKHELPYLPLYDCETHGQTRETLRNTGWLSTDGAAIHGRLPWLKRHYPNQYLMLVCEFPEVKEMA